jgi:hypothetical protein
MEKVGLIYRVRGLDCGGVAWALTKKASLKLGSPYPHRSFSRNTLVHDVALGEIRCAMEKAGICSNWVPEHALKAQAMQKLGTRNEDRPFVPDAIFSIQQAGSTRVVALELELHGKATKRYENILERYRRKKSIWALWYVVPTEPLGHTIERVWNRINYGRRNDLLMWLTLDSLIQCPLIARVRNEHLNYSVAELLQSKAPALAGALPGSTRQTATTERLASRVF